MAVFQRALGGMASRWDFGYQPIGGAGHPKKMSRALLLTILAIISLVSIAAFTHIPNIASSFVTDTVEQPVEAQEPWITEIKPPRDSRFVIVVPATAPSPNLCKFLLTAIALGYPTPVIVNWGVDYHTISKWEKGKNLSKIPGIKKYLDALLHENAHPDERLEEDDIVLIADGYDIWFQLPPDVLLKRYHDSNEKANARLRKEWKSNKPMPMQQSIIVAAQKRCYPTPDSGSNMHCDRMPESPMRKDLYGPMTDVKVKGDHSHNERPRFINGGTYIGRAGDLRHMFERVLFKMESEIDKGVKLYSEQGISGEVLGEQELWRQMQRSWHGREEDNETMTFLQRDFEYHIGLDYTQEISIATVFEEIDGDIIALNNKSGIADRSASLGISPVRLKGVPKDIKASKNPLSGMVEKPEWGEMPLYADFFSEAIPVMLHHNAHENGLKQRREWWWDRTWYFPYLRQLVLQHQSVETLKPVAKVKTKEGVIEYWPPSADKLSRNPRLLTGSAEEPLKTMKFDDLCREPDPEDGTQPAPWWEEVFRDGKGGLEDLNG